MSDTEIKQYASKLRIDGVDPKTYYLKDAATLAEVQVLRKEMGNWQVQLNSLISQLRALETKVNNQTGTDPTPSTNIPTKEDVEQAAQDAADEALKNKTTEIDVIIGQISDILLKNEDALVDFYEAQDQAELAAQYAEQSMQYSSISKDYSLKALSQVSPIVADYAYTTADITRCLDTLADQYDELNSVKTKVTATTEAMIDGQKVTADFIKKTSESITKSSQTMIAQYNSSQQDPSTADPTADHPLSSTLTRISSTVSQTAQSWGAQVSSFSYQDASQDEETQEKIDKSIKDYEEALAAQEKAYLTLNDATIAYGEAKQWYADAEAYYNSCSDLYSQIADTATGNSQNLSDMKEELSDAAKKLQNCVAKIKQLNGSKDEYRKELQDSVLTLVTVYGTESVPDINEALVVVQAKVESIELVSDELGVNISTLKVLLEDYSSKLAAYLALTQSGDLIDQQLQAIEDLEENAKKELAEAEEAIKTAAKKYNEALDLLKTTADAIDKAANGLVVNQTAALIVKKGEVLGYVNTLRESAVTYQKSLCAKYTEFVSAVRNYHSYNECDVRFWFYSVEPDECTAEDFLDRFPEGGNSSRGDYQDYYYNTTDSKAYVWKESGWTAIVPEKNGDAASELLAALQKAQNYSDIDEDNYRNLYFYNNGYKSKDGEVISPREYSKLTTEEQKNYSTEENDTKENDTKEDNTKENDTEENDTKEDNTEENSNFPSNYQVGDIWYSSLYDNNVTITKVVPHYLTYPYATGVSTVNNNPYNNRSVGNWVTNSTDVTFFGKMEENGTDRAANFLWYYCEIGYSNGNTVNTSPVVVGSYSSDITDLAITPYIMVTNKANSSIKPGNNNNTSSDSSDASGDTDSDTGNTDSDTGNNTSSGWQDISNGWSFETTYEGDPIQKYLSNYGEDMPYLFTYVKMGDEKKDESGKVTSDTTINSPVVYIDSYVYNNGILVAELEHSTYTPGDWVNCWVAQSRQIAGGLNRVWDYVNASLAITQNQILATVKALAQLENDTYENTYTGIDQKQDSINLYATQRKGKASAFTCETVPTSQTKIAVNVPQTGGLLFSPWETVYEQTTYKTVRVVKNVNDYWFARISDEDWSDVPVELSGIYDYTSITYNKDDGWELLEGTPQEGTKYTADQYTIIVSNMLENGNIKGRALVNTTITVNFAYATNVTYPLLELRSKESENKEDLILEAIPIAAYGEWLNNYSSEKTTITSNKAYNWEAQSVVSLTLHVPTDLNPDICWYDPFFDTEEAAKAEAIPSQYYKIRSVDDPVTGTSVKDVYGKVILYDSEANSSTTVGDIYWEICDSSGLQKSSSLKIDLDKITAQVQDINTGLTQLTLNPDGFNVNISSVADRSDRQLLEVPDPSEDIPINAEGETLLKLHYSNLEWMKAVDTSDSGKIVHYESSTGLLTTKDGKDTSVKRKIVYYGGTEDEDGTVSGYKTVEYYNAVYDGKTLTVSDAPYQAITTGQDIKNGKYYPPLSAKTGADFYSFVNTKGTTGYVVAYKEKIVPFEANLSYRIGCYVNVDNSIGLNDSNGYLNIIVGKPPKGIGCELIESSMSTSIKEEKATALNANGMADTAKIKLSSGWQYVYVDFTFNHAVCGTVVPGNKDVVIGARVTFEIHPPEGCAYAVTGLHVTCLDAAKGVNNYLRMTAKDGLVLGDMTRSSLGTGSYYAQSYGDTLENLNANIQLTVADTVKVDLENDEGTVVETGAEISDPAINLRYGEDDLVHISAVDATTFYSYKIKQSKSTSEGGYSLVPDDKSWVKIASKLPKNAESGNTKPLSSIVAGGSPGILICNSSYNGNMEDITAAGNETAAQIRKQIGMIGMFAINGNSINDRFISSQDDGTIVSTGLITGNSFMLAAGAQGWNGQANISSNGMIGFQTDKQTIYNGTQDWTNGAVIYKGQHIYGKDAWVYGLYYFKAINKWKEVKANKTAALTIKIQPEENRGNFYPGAIRELAITSTTENKKGKSISDNQSVGIMGYKCDKSEDKKTYTLTVYLRNFTKKTRKVRVRAELLMFRREHR